MWTTPDLVITLSELLVNDWIALITPKSGGEVHLSPDGIGGCPHRQKTDGYQLLEFHISSPSINFCVAHSRLHLRNLSPQLVGTLAKEAQQARVYLFRVRPRDTVRAMLRDQLARSFDERGGAKASGRDGKDAVRIPLNHQRGHIDETGNRGSLHARSGRTPGWRQRKRWPRRSNWPGRLVR